MRIREEEPVSIGDHRLTPVDTVMDHGAGRLRDEREARRDEDTDAVVMRNPRTRLRQRVADGW